ncbi:tetratricopeptide repeat protein [Actinoplanes sp. KI2]|uniref:tetratricopeptide repeat protein n=1 Tax=Actinoplanes sp. KI2 TaxID=2983315 RepID=UPI0021D58BB1|nr:tetratricopeptide repeat protein [Actinoplanes sp. KI2]MCU7729932.1 tetratricopeptide repeat protein [Actinoplanes sp. KI2]
MEHEALSALLAARNTNQMRRVVSDHPDLLDAAVDADLVRRLAAARAAGDLGTAHALERCRGVLRRCREVGIPAAFHELVEGAAERFESLLATAREADEQYSATDDVAALHRLVDAYGYLVNHPATLLADRSAQAAIYNNAATAFLRRRLHPGAAAGTGDLERAVELALAASNLAEAGTGDESVALDNYGRALYQRFRHGGAARDLDRAIAAHNTVAGRGPAAVASWRRVANDLAVELLDRYQLTGDPDDLDRAIRVDTAALDAASPARPEVETAKRLGISLRTRYQRTGNPADLDAAVTSHGAAVTVAALFGSPSAGLLTGLGASLAGRYRLRGDPADLTEAVAALSQAVAAAPGGTVAPVLRLNHAAILQLRYEATGDDEGLEAAVDAARDAVAAMPAGDAERASLLSDLGALLRDRFERRGDPAALAEALDAHREALAGSRQHADRLNAFGRTLQSRHRLTGDPHDLDSAVDAYREALDLTPAGRPDRALYVANLGAALSTRARLTGDLADADAAIETLDAALAATPAGAAERGDRLENLANALSARRRQGPGTDDLDRVIAMYDEAVALRADGSPKRPITLLNLGNALRTRYQLTGDGRDIDRAVTRHRAALSTLAADSPYYGNALSALSGDLLLRGREPGHGDDLVEAVGRAEAALAATAPEAPDRVAIESALATALWVRSLGSGDRADADAAAAHSRSAARRGLTGLPEGAVIAGYVWSHMAARLGRWSESAEGGELALSGLETLVSIQLTRAHQESWLTAMGGVAADTAYAHTRGARGEQAVLALERGRSLLLTEVLERDRGIRDLASLDRADLTDRFRRAAERLQPQLSTPPDDPSRLLR